MRFPCKFSRRHGAAPASVPVLGSDSLPAGLPAAGADNVMTSRFQNNMGWPIHRVAVVYTPPSGTTALNAALYMFERQTGAWYAVKGEGGSYTATPLTPGRVTFFDCVALLDQPPNASTLENSQGSIAMCLIVATGAVDDGEHKFAVGPDLSTFQ